MIILSTQTNEKDDEILEVAIVNENNEILLNQHFKPTKQSSYEIELIKNGNTPDSLQNLPTFDEYKDKIISIIENEDIYLYNFNDEHLLFKKINYGDLPHKPDIYDLSLAFAKIYGDKDVRVPLETASKFYNFETFSSNTIGKAQATLNLYNNIEERKYSLLNVGNIEEAKKYSMMEFGKKIVFKYNEDFKKGFFTVKDINDTYEFYYNHNIESGVEGLIKYTLQTNYCPDKIIEEYKNHETSNYLESLNIQGCIKDATIRHDFKTALENVENGRDLSESLSWSFSKYDINKLTEIHKEHPELRDKIIDLLEDCNFHEVWQDLKNENYENYINDDEQQNQEDLSL